MKLDAPITITDIEQLGKSAYMPPIERAKKGSLLVSVRPVDPELEGKTFLGIYIGDIAQSIGGGIEGSTLKLHFSMYNPAIFVPELQRIIFGYESWWSPITSEEQLREITNEDIENVWYVQALRQFFPKEEDNR